MIQGQTTTVRDVRRPLEGQARRAREAAQELRCTTRAQRTAAICAMASRLRGGVDEILQANHADLGEARREGLGDAKLDRLKLDEKRLEEVAAGLEAVAGLPDPVGEVVDD